MLDDEKENRKNYLEAQEDAGLEVLAVGRREPLVLEIVDALLGDRQHLGQQLRVPAQQILHQHETGRRRNP